MKAIIPVAGVAHKLKSNPHKQPRALLPVAGKPVLAHIIDEMVKAGVAEFVFIIGALGYKIKQYILDHYGHLQVSFVIQEERRGTAHALWVAREHIKAGESLAIVFGDSIVSINLKKFLQQKDSAVAVKKVDNPSLYGIAEIGKDGSVKKLVEKPRIPKSNLALVGLYKINDAALLLRGLEQVMAQAPNSSAEYHLTDALMHIVSEGGRIAAVEVKHWYNCGKKDTLLEANETMLNKGNFKSAEPEEYPDCILIPPVWIGKKCELSNAVIGPNVTIGDHAVVDSSIIKDSIIGSGAKIYNMLLSHSVAGNDALLRGRLQSVNIDDDNALEVDFD